MTTYTPAELEEAKTAIDSLIHKCEMALQKIEKGSSQHTLLTRRIKALQISANLILEKMSELKNNNHGLQH
ncbi:hypothetical protein SAMN05421747_107161 [Parapedobacter composti]|uniref:Uncharacterized protein n=1 Tax=Parapedobacter composti TaxID=623281 RepID=A0A1I1I2D5_9SPHI|nr:hypothetical protein [Parapedobacter composti]SFC28378.1 hypothetical protein SAMN05421747_107161 [Parapedobacter composti]